MIWREEHIPLGYTPAYTEYKAPSSIYTDYKPPTTTYHEYQPPTYKEYSTSTNYQKGFWSFLYQSLILVSRNYLKMELQRELHQIS